MNRIIFPKLNTRKKAIFWETQPKVRPPIIHRDHRKQLNEFVVIGFGLTLLIIVLGLTLVEPSWADDAAQGHINYAYSTWVGTGYYSVGDKQVFILRGRYTKPLLDSGPGEKWALDLLLQGTIGFYQFTNQAEDVGAITAVPGLMVRYRMQDNWWLKPFAQLGVGKDFSGGDAVLIGGAGIKSLAAFPRNDGIVWELGNSLTFADNSDSDKYASDNGFSMFEIGLNRRNPIPYRVLDKRTDLNLFFVYTEFLNDLEFFQVDFHDTRIQRLFKFGFALTSSEDFPILGFKFRGGGMDVTWGENYLGIGFNMGFPF